MSKNYVIRKIKDNEFKEIIAEVCDKKDKKRIALIEYDPLLRHKTGNQAQAKRFISKDTNEDRLLITINDKYKNLFDTQPNLFEGVVMHEVGHLVNGDFSPKENVEERAEAIINNDVDIKEIKADEFAAEEIGKKRFIKYLEWTINNRKKLEFDHPINKQMAINEFENRIKILKNK